MDMMASLRRSMVDCQLRTYDVTNLAVLDAFDTVARDAFVPAASQTLAYLDRPVLLDPASGRSLLTPMVAARMIQTLAVKPGEHVLDYAGGTGYTAAILAHLGAKVTLVEPVAALASQATARLAGLDVVSVVGSLAACKPGFDAILVNGSCGVAPTALFDLLAEEGRLVMVEGAGRSGSVLLAQKSGGRVSSRAVFDAAAPVLPEFAPKPEFAL